MAHMHKRHEYMGKRYGARGAEESPSSAAYVREDQSKNAGVPTEVKIIHMSRDERDYLTERHDDTIRGIEARLGHDASAIKGNSAMGRKC